MCARAHVPVCGLPTRTPAHLPTARHLGTTPPPGGQAPARGPLWGGAHLPPGPSFPLCPLPCASPTAHPRAVPSPHMPATPTPAHAFPRPPKDPNPLSQNHAHGPRLPSPALPTPAQLRGLLTCPCPGQASPLPSVLWGSWAGGGCPALHQQSDPAPTTSKLGGRTAGSHTLRAHPCPPPSRRRKPTGPSLPRSPAQFLEEG